MTLTEQYAEHLEQVPRRTNECWMGNMTSGNEVYVCGHKFIVALNGTALAIWKAMDGRRSVSEIGEYMATRYRTANAEDVLEGTVGLIRELEEFGLAAWRTRPLFEGIEFDA